MWNGLRENIPVGISMKYFYRIISLVVVMGCASKPNTIEESPIKEDTILIESIQQVTFNEASYVLDGLINKKFPIVIYLSFAEEVVNGKYFYKKIQNFISLDGVVQSDSLFLTEKDGDKVTGYFILSMNTLPEISGYWMKPDSSLKYSVELTNIKSFSLSDPVRGTGIQKNVKPNSDTYEVLYNLNGIFTEAVYDVDEQGFRSTIYKSTNIGTNKPLSFTDVFKPEARETVKEMIKRRIIEDCPEQVGSGDKIIDEALTELTESLFVGKNTFFFPSLCERSAGYFLGMYTVHFTYDEVKEFLRNSN